MPAGDERAWGWWLRAAGMEAARAETAEVVQVRRMRATCAAGGAHSWDSIGGGGWCSSGGASCGGGGGGSRSSESLGCRGGGGGGGGSA